MRDKERKKRRVALLIYIANILALLSFESFLRPGRERSEGLRRLRPPYGGLRYIGICLKAVLDILV